ncbi:hypothetical protein TNCV_3453281 [Trichonephila clavipes]|nr:hypothetical protein TNCV_3453281 [Trichonephila clavipes]
MGPVFVTRNVCQGYHKASTSAKCRYLTLSAPRYRLTAVAQLSRDLAAVSGKRISSSEDFDLNGSVVKGRDLPGVSPFPGQYFSNANPD